VTPQINEGNTVVLKVEIEVSSIAPTSEGAVDIVTNKRTVKTTVLIPDGGTLVIGGLIQDKATNTEQRVPFLSRIPLIGELFRSRDTSKAKTNLMVFLQPHILHDDHAAAIETDSKYNYIREEQRKQSHDSAVLPLAPFQKLEPMPPLVQPDLAPTAAPKAAPAATAIPAPTPAPTPAPAPAPATTPAPATPAPASGNPPSGSPP
jgi:general secretion pathway protein D